MAKRAQPSLDERASRTLAADLFARVGEATPTWRSWSTLTPTQQTALELYALGLNIGVQPFGQKLGFPWKSLQYTRLYYNPADPRADDLLEATGGRCNLCVLTGRTSRCLFILDCETNLALRHMNEQLEERNIPLWVVISPSRRGGGHVYFLRLM